MNYVYVAGGLQSEGVLDLAITRQTKNALYSLIGGLKQADFGLHTIEQVTADIRQFSKANTLPVGGKILTDSGGYSFLRGDIEPSLIGSSSFDVEFMKPLRPESGPQSGRPW